MKDLYPAFPNKVDFYAIGQSETETLDQFEHDQMERDYPWPIAQIHGDVLKKLQVVQQSTKIALNAQGVISYRGGYGKGGVDKWREVLSDLADPS